LIAFTTSRGVIFVLSWKTCAPRNPAKVPAAAIPRRNRPARVVPSANLRKKRVNLPQASHAAIRVCIGDAGHRSTVALTRRTCRDHT